MRMRCSISRLPYHQPLHYLVTENWRILDRPDLHCISLGFSSYACVITGKNAAKQQVFQSLFRCTVTWTCELTVRNREACTAGCIWTMAAEYILRCIMELITNMMNCWPGNRTSGHGSTIVSMPPRVSKMSRPRPLYY